MVVVHPFTDTSMGVFVSSFAMTSDFIGRIRPHVQQVLQGLGPGDSGIRVLIGSVSHRPIM